MRGLNSARKRRWKSHQLVKQRFRCAYCRAAISEQSATIDHVVPKSRGGKTVISNFVLVCKPCNVAKADRLPGDPEWPV